jgi:hypothetical protein
MAAEIGLSGGDWRLKSDGLLTIGAQNQAISCDYRKTSGDLLRLAENSGRSPAIIGKHRVISCDLGENIGRSLAIGRKRRAMSCNLRLKPDLPGAIGG